MWKELIKLIAVCTLVLCIGCKTEVSNSGGGSSPSATIIFVDESGKTLSTQKVYGGKVSFNYKKTGYKNFFFDSTGKQVYSGSFSTIKSCKITVKSEPISYKIKFKTSSSALGKVSGVLPDDMTCVYETEYNLPENNIAYTYSGTVYRPCGWTKDRYGYSKNGEYSSGQKIKNLSSSDGNEIILYACFNNSGAVELRFYKNDYSYTTVYAENGEKISGNAIPKPNDKTGYVFEGYYVSTDTAQTVIDFTTYRVTGKTNFMPKYSLGKYKVTFVNEHGAAPSPVTWTYTSSSSTVANLSSGTYLLSATGYDFDGWYKQGTSTKKTSIDSYYDHEDMTLTARWNPWYAELRYDKNAPSGVSSGGNMGWNTVYYDSSEKLKKNTFFATGYSFKGWNTKADGSGTFYADGASFTWKDHETRQIVYLYAQWQKLQTSINVSIVSPSTDSDIRLKYNSSAKRFEAEFPGSSVFRWYIDGVVVDGENGPTLSAYCLGEGHHSVMVATDFTGRTYGTSVVANVTLSE